MKYSMEKDLELGLYRITALIDIPSSGIRAGDKGGLISAEANLSQEGSAWVYGNAQVSGNARIFGSAWVSDSAWVYGNAKVTKCLFFQQHKHPITITDTHVFIGCEGHTWEQWNANILQIGMNNFYSEVEIQEVKALLKIAKAQLDRM